LNTKRIVITGGPGTGKTSIINELTKRGYLCSEEVSRQIILEAQKKGIEQLFLTDPLLFSQMLLEGRIKQFTDAESLNESFTFIDRGIPDIVAYMNYIGSEYPEPFVKACKNYIYDHVFILAPWQDIYKSDNERYESFDQALLIHDCLLDTYTTYGYELHDVPFDTITKRADFILNIVEQL